MIEKFNIAQKAGVPVSGMWIQDWSGQKLTPFGNRVFWNWKWNPNHYPGLLCYQHKLSLALIMRSTPRFVVIIIIMFAKLYYFRAFDVYSGSLLLFFVCLFSFVSFFFFFFFFFLGGGFVLCCY